MMYTIIQISLVMLFTRGHRFTTANTSIRHSQPFSFAADKQQENSYRVSFDYCRIYTDYETNLHETKL